MFIFFAREIVCRIIIIVFVFIILFFLFFYFKEIVLIFTVNYFTENNKDILSFLEFCSIKELYYVYIKFSLFYSFCLLFPIIFLHFYYFLIPSFFFF